MKQQHCLPLGNLTEGPRPVEHSASACCFQFRPNFGGQAPALGTEFLQPCAWFPLLRNGGSKDFSVRTVWPHIIVATLLEVTKRVGLPLRAASLLTLGSWRGPQLPLSSDPEPPITLRRAADKSKSFSSNTPVPTWSGVASEMGTGASNVWAVKPEAVLRLLTGGWELSGPIPGSVPSFASVITSGVLTSPT